MLSGGSCCPALFGHGFYRVRLHRSRTLHRVAEDPRTPTSANVPTLQLCLVSLASGFLIRPPPGVDKYYFKPSVSEIGELGRADADVLRFL